MPTATRRQLVTDAILTVLTSAGLAAGDGEAPAGAAAPYVVLYPVGQGATEGPINDDQADVDWLYQITAVGVDRWQAEHFADQARAAMLAGTFTVTGRAVRPVAWSSEPVQRDEAMPDRLYYAIDTYRMQDNHAP